MHSSVILLVALITYAALHSLLATHRTKNWARRTFGVFADRYYRLFYNFVAVLTFLPVLAILIHNPGKIFYRISQPWLTLILLAKFFRSLS